MDKEERLKQLTLRLPEDLHRDLKIRAAVEGRSMGSIIESLVRAYLDQRKHAQVTAK